MAIDSKHPLYTKFGPFWVQTSDTYEGEHAVKEKGTDYLPATSGQIADGLETDSNSIGYKAYQAYKRRAVVPGIYRDAVNSAIGLMHKKPPVFNLPKAMESLLEKATVKGESLALLLRRINEAQLKTGRIGLLPDLPLTPVVGAVLPYIAVYSELTVINWDDGRREDPVLQNLNLVVLDESEPERDTNFEWEFRRKYRVLVLGDPDANEAQGVGVYSQALFRDNDPGGLTFSTEKLQAPTLQGMTLDFIPFTFINAADLLPEPDYPPLLDLSNLVLTIYRGEADYRQSLFMQGQDTLVVQGGVTDNDTPIKLGATGRIDVPKGGDAKFIGVDSTGLTEQREAIRNDRADARELAGKLLDTMSRSREAEGTVKMRIGAQTATLNQIALAGAEGLQTQLRYIAEWAGIDPEKVEVIPNLNFAGSDLTGRDLLDLQSAKNQGAPISLETIHNIMVKHDVTELDFEEEMERIENEAPLSQGRSTGDDDLEDGEAEFDEDGNPIDPVAEGDE